MPDNQKILDEVNHAITGITKSLSGSSKDALMQAVEALDEKLTGFYESYRENLKNQTSINKANTVDKILMGEAENNNYLKQIQEIAPKIAMVNGQLPKPKEGIDSIQELANKIQKNLDVKIGEAIEINQANKQKKLNANQPAPEKEQPRPDGPSNKK